MKSGPALGRRLGAEFVGSLLLAAVVVGSGIAAQQLSPTDVGPSADRERRRYGPWTVRHHLDVRPGQRSSFQPGGVLRRCCFRWAAVAHRGGLPARPGRRLHRRRRAGQPHVRRAGRLVQHPPPHHRTALPRRDRGHRRAGPGHLRPGPHRPHQPTPRRPSAPTSARPTSSPAAPASPIRRSPIGRMFSDTFAGIAPSSAPGFIAAQLIGGAVGFALVRLFYPRPRPGRHLGRGRPRSSHGRRRP